MRKLAILAALVCIAYAMTGCATTTAPDGTTTKAVDPAAVALAFQTAEIALAEYHRQHPAPREIHPAK